MTYPYHLAVHGVFFEVMKNGGVAIIRKSESRLSGRTLLRVELTAEQWAVAIAAMKKVHDELGRPSTLGPISKQGSAPDSLPAAGPPPPTAGRPMDKSYQLKKKKN